MGVPLLIFRFILTKNEGLRQKSEKTIACTIDKGEKWYYNMAEKRVMQRAAVGRLFKSLAVSGC